MNYKQRETSREIRLWLTQIIVPAATLTTTILAIPEVRGAVASKAKDMKQTIENKLKKEKGS